jgi:hypothetical protein
MLALGLLPVSLPETHDEQARAAIAELDETDEPLFRRAHAALGRLHPEQDAYVFADLGAGRGVEAVVSVARFLDRVDSLQSSDNEGDRAAVETLDKRGINAQYREQLRRLVKTAQSAQFPVETVPPDASNEQRVQALQELYAWYRDWAETARAVIHRRDLLILLGLARRRRNSRGEEEPVDSEPEAESAVEEPTAEPEFAPSSLV